METILFVGNKVSGHFVSEVAKSRGYEYHQIDCKAGSCKKTTNEILTYVYAKRLAVNILIYDVDIYIDDAAEIAEEISGTAKTLNAKPIVYMPSFLPESLLAQALYAKDIKRFIFSGTGTDLKDQLEKNITGFYDANERKETIEIAKKQQEAKAKIENFKSIGIAGTQQRIGTTTQAIQIVKYLTQKGYTACYIELNQNTYFDMSRRSGELRAVSFVEKYEIWMTADSTSNKGIVTYNEVDMYKGQEALAAAKKSYDYYVYDYGSVFDRDFDRTAFMKDDIKILVGGMKPQEYDYLDRIIRLPQYAAAGVIISLAAENSQDEMLKPLADVIEDGKVIAFADYTPDPFCFLNPALYENLIPIKDREDGMTEESAEKKKTWLSIRRKKVVK